MRRRGRTFRQIFTLEDAFQKLRNSPAHQGMGSIRLTIEDQEELCEVAQRQFINASVRCEQLIAFCEWIAREKNGKIEKGTEQALVLEWAKG